MSALQEDNTAAHLAAKFGHTEVLQKIIETGVDVDERNTVSGMFLLLSFLKACVLGHYF